MNQSDLRTQTALIPQTCLTDDIHRENEVLYEKALVMLTSPDIRRRLIPEQLRILRGIVRYQGVNDYNPPAVDVLKRLAKLHKVFEVPGNPLAPN